MADRLAEVEAAVMALRARHERNLWLGQLEPIRLDVAHTCPEGMIWVDVTKAGRLVATGFARTMREAIADAARQYRIKRARRWARNVHSRPTVRP